MELNGLSEEKASDHLLQNENRKYYILFLGETWQHKDNLDNFHHPLGYFHDFVYRKNFNERGGSSGGMLFHCRSELQGKVPVYDKSSENIIWIKKDKGVNDYENNIFVACVYNSPENLRCTMFYDSNVIDRLEQQLKKFSSSDLILIGGYFNSRAWNEPDYITEDTRNMSFLPGDYEPDKFTVSRNNEDVSINYFG